MPILAQSYTNAETLGPPCQGGWHGVSRDWGVVKTNYPTAA